MRHGNDALRGLGAPALAVSCCAGHSPAVQCHRDICVARAGCTFSSMHTPSQPSIHLHASAPCAPRCAQPQQQVCQGSSLCAVCCSGTAGSSARGTTRALASCLTRQAITHTQGAVLQREQHPQRFGCTAAVHWTAGLNLSANSLASPSTRAAACQLTLPGECAGSPGQHAAPVLHALVGIIQTCSSSQVALCRMCNVCYAFGSNVVP